MIRVLSQLLMDRESLSCYDRGKIVAFSDVARRLKLLERNSDLGKPDYFYSGAQKVSLENILSLPGLLSDGICKIAKECLTLRGMRVYVQPEKMDDWQKLCCQMPPLLLQCGVLLDLLAESTMEKSGLRTFIRNVLSPNIHYTAIPSPYIPELFSLIKEEGFIDLHLHLNGAIETDRLWQYMLCNSHKVSKDFGKQLRKIELVKEQAEQEELGFDNINFRKRLERAAKLRREIVCSLLGNDSSKTLLVYGHPMCEYLDLDPYSIRDDYNLELEAIMYLLVMLQLKRHPEDPNSIATKFHEYILILGMVNRFAVQQVYQNGFEQFQKITSNDFRESCEKIYNKRFYQWDGPDQNYISFIEGRFSPKKTSLENKSLLKGIIKGWEKFIKTKRTKDCPQLKLIAHFIKVPENIKKDQYLKNLSNKYDTLIRWRNLRKELRTRAIALMEVKKNPCFNKYIVGIDAAANEMDAPPEVFAEVYRYLRKRGIMHFTFHAGEDFRHLISGLRTMFEAIIFLHLDYGDRLGHGTAAGIDPDLWIYRMGGSIFISRGEWLDDLIFLHYLISESSEKSNLSYLIPIIEMNILNLAAQIYEKTFSVYSLRTAWLMRKYSPFYILNMIEKSDKDSFWFSIYSDNEKEDVKNKLDNQEIRELVRYYHINKYRDNYDKMVSISPTLLFKVEELKEFQLLILKKIRSKNIIIESLPTSNVRISFYQKSEEHHITNWLAQDEKGVNPSVVLGTDDTGVFCTNIFNEYAYVYCQLLDKGYTSTSAINVIKQIKETSKIYRFTN